MSKVPAQPELISGLVSEDITRLANQTFDRLAPHFAPYLADERRDRPGGGTTLTADNEGVLWEGGAYGQVPTIICNRDSLKEVAKAFNDDPQVREATGLLSEDASHYKFIQESVVVGDPEHPSRYTIGGVALLLHVLRDRYPKGVVDARESMWSYHRGVGQYSPSEYGERHKVGIELVTRYEDAAAPGRPATWRFGMSAQTRFDKPSPRWEMTSRFQGMVDTYDMERAAHFDPDASFKPTLKEVRDASETDVAAMERFFALAKDIRPRVTPIEQLLKEHGVIGTMFEKFFGTDVLEAETASPSV